MDLRQLEYFAAVARHRHFRRAAEDLYVSQSAVSQQVRRLEDELGLQLLHRTPKGVELTVAGGELLARAEAILADVARARTAMEQHAGVLRGQVRVAATTGDVLRLPAALARFHREHPAVRLALRHGSAGAVVELVATGAADLAVAALADDGDAVAAQAGLEAVALRDDPLVVVVPPGDPVADGGGPVRLWDLRDRPFVLAEPGTALREAVVAACADEGFGPVPLIEVSDAASVRQLVHAGLGVSLVPASWAAIAGPEVGVVVPAGTTTRHALWLLARPGRLSPVSRLVHERLRDDLGG
ncbi:MAG TPA: LysR family transcriptional regulator [Baekduia sp.]|nr:LysR family transcriptional regulator [Baekduia sp.]